MNYIVNEILYLYNMEKIDGLHGWKGLINMGNNTEYAFIWDMDGTLIDSYGAIVKSVKRTYAEYGIETDADEIRRVCMKYSVSYFLELMEKRTGRPFSEMIGVYSEISEAENKEIGLIDNVREILEYLDNKGCRNFVYTHRGASTFEILERCGIDRFFTEVVTKKNGFGRKPEPDGINYLVDKYGLDRQKTFYVGDRSIDMECAANAGIGGILYLPGDAVTEPVGTERYIVRDLEEISEACRN